MLKLILKFFLLFLLIAPVSYAATCKPVNFRVEKGDIILENTNTTITTQIYFLKNKSLHAVFIDRAANKNPGASAGWASYLQPGNWSALALNKKSYAIHCSMIEPGKVIPLDCSRTLSICIPQNFVSKKPLKGNFWVVEDKNWKDFSTILAKKGLTAP